MNKFTLLFPIATTQQRTYLRSIIIDLLCTDIDFYIVSDPLYKEITVQELHFKDRLMQIIDENSKEVLHGT